MKVNKRARRTLAHVRAFAKKTSGNLLFALAVGRTYVFEAHLKPINRTNSSTRIRMVGKIYLVASKPRSGKEPLFVSRNGGGNNCGGYYEQAANAVSCSTPKGVIGSGERFSVFEGKRLPPAKDEAPQTQ